MSRASSWQNAGMLLLLLFVQPGMGEDSETIRGAIHTIVNVECTPYFTFQILALAFTYKRVGNPGPITRIMACSRRQRKKISEEDLKIMNTHITPQYSHDAVLGDYYPPYNRPAGIVHWLKHAKPREEWLLMVDPDVIFRHPVQPSRLRVPRGWARAAHANFLVGTRNELADKHIPYARGRMDNNGGQVGRKADEAATYFFLRKEDMRRVAPLWSDFTRDVRADPDAWRLSGDQYAEEGQSVWISEMYGWAFSMAESDIWHLLETGFQAFPGLSVHDVPTISHYAYSQKLLNFSFDKHDHQKFDITKCPPWNLKPNRAEEEDGGLFPHPPYPHEIIDHQDPRRRYGELLMIEAVNTLNEALCDRHWEKCELSLQLVTECGKVDKIRDELRIEFGALDEIVCRDVNSKVCEMRKGQGHCKKHWLEMNYSCRKTCGLCFDHSLPEGEYTDLQVRQASEAHHVVENLSGYLKPKFKRSAGKSKTMSIAHERKCGNTREEGVSQDPRCGTQDDQDRAYFIDFKSMVFEEQESSKDVVVSFVLLATLIFVALGCFLSGLVLRKYSTEHYLSIKRV